MTETLVWDASALYHAIVADRVDVLGDLASPWRNISTATVNGELRRKGLNLVAPWIEIVHVDEPDELRSLLTWAQTLGAGPRDAKRVAVANGLDAHGTLWLFTEAVNTGRCSLASVSGLVNVLMDHGARYPAKIRNEGFAAWARAQKLV